MLFRKAILVSRGWAHLGWALALGGAIGGELLWEFDSAVLALAPSVQEQKAGGNRLFQQEVQPRQWRSVGWLPRSSIGLLASSGSALLPTQTAKPMSPFSLNTFQWKNRLLLVFAPDAASAEYRSQLRLLEPQQAELADRDLLLIPVLGTGETTVQGQSIDSAASSQLRDQFGVQPDQFCVILVGKDGTEKRRERQPVPPNVLYDQIDAMPMRQREMREK